LVTEAHRCEQLAQGCYAALSRVGFEPATYRSQVRRSTVTLPRHLPKTRTLDLIGCSNYAHPHSVWTALEAKDWHHCFTQCKYLSSVVKLWYWRQGNVQEATSLLSRVWWSLKEEDGVSFWLVWVSALDSFQYFDRARAVLIQKFFLALLDEMQIILVLDHNVLLLLNKWKFVKCLTSLVSFYWSPEQLQG